jgi:hypothetical protein
MEKPCWPCRHTVAGTASAKGRSCIGAHRPSGCAAWLMRFCGSARGRRRRRHTATTSPESHARTSRSVSSSDEISTPAGRIGMLPDRCERPTAPLDDPQMEHEITCQIRGPLGTARAAGRSGCPRWTRLRIGIGGGGRRRRSGCGRRPGRQRRSVVRAPAGLRYVRQRTAAATGATPELLRLGRGAARTHPPRPLGARDGRDPRWRGVARVCARRPVMQSASVVRDVGDPVGVLSAAITSTTHPR